MTNKEIYNKLKTDIEKVLGKDCKSFLYVLLWDYIEYYIVPEGFDHVNDVAYGIYPYPSNSRRPTGYLIELYKATMDKKDEVFKFLQDNLSQYKITKKDKKTYIQIIVEGGNAI